jgi:hypothetical protein
MAGYSGTPLPKKLGIKNGHIVAFIAAPDAFAEALGPLPESVQVSTSARGDDFDVIVFFVTRRRELARRFEALSKHIHMAGGLWIAWPKRASGVATDITEDGVREIALDIGLVDNKVCAIDETWSGLRCVHRLEDRPQR